MDAKMSYKSKRLAIIVAVIVVLVAAISVGTYYFIQGNDDTQAAYTENEQDLAEANNGESETAGDSEEQTNPADDQDDENEEELNQGEEEPQEPTNIDDNTDNNTSTGTTTEGTNTSNNGTTSGNDEDIPNEEYTQVDTVETEVERREREVSVGWSNIALATAQISTNITTNKPNLTINKTATVVNSLNEADNAVQIGSKIRYDITVTNNNTDTIEVNVSDIIPNGTKFDSETEATNGVTPDENGRLLWVVEVPAKVSDTDTNNTVTLSFTVEVINTEVGEEAVNEIRNVAVVNGKNTNETVNPIIETEKTILNAPEVIQEGSEIEYGIIVNNKSAEVAKTTIRDSVPEGTTLVRDENEIPAIYINGVIATENSYTITTDETGREVITWNNVEVGEEEFIVSFKVTVDAFEGDTKTISNTATVGDKTTETVDDEAHNYYYKVEYYKDSISEENKLAETELAKELLGTNITDAIVAEDFEEGWINAERPTGYQDGAVQDVNGTDVEGYITISTTGNVIQVVYEKDVFEYKVEYYKDSISTENKITETEVAEEIFGTNVTDAVVAEDFGEGWINAEKPTGYKDGEVQDANGADVEGYITISTSGNVIQVVYEKDVFEYKVEYYKDSISTENKITETEPASEIFGTNVTDAVVAEDFGEGWINAEKPAGYKDGEVQDVNGTDVEGYITISTSGNVIQVVYEKDVFEYKVEYYKDSISTENKITETEVAEEIFGTNVTDAIVAEDFGEGWINAERPTGYQDGAVQDANGTDVEGYITINTTGNVVQVLYVKEDVKELNLTVVPTTTEAVPQRAILVLDFSSSMEGIRLEQLKVAVNLFLEEFLKPDETGKGTTGNEVVIIEYDKAIVNDTPIGPSSDMNVLDISDHDIPDRGTNIDLGLTVAHNYISDTKNTTVILMSDGVPYQYTDENGETKADSETSARNEAIESAEKIKKKGVNLFTIGFKMTYGNGDELMLEMASSDKTFHAPNNGEDLNEAFQTISSTITEVHDGNPISYQTKNGVAEITSGFTAGQNVEIYTTTYVVNTTKTYETYTWDQFIGLDYVTYDANNGKITFDLRDYITDEEISEDAPITIRFVSDEIDSASNSVSNGVIIKSMAALQSEGTYLAVMNELYNEDEEAEESDNVPEMEVEGQQPSDVPDESEEVKEELQGSDDVPGMEVEGQQPSDVIEESEEVKEELQDSEDVPEMKVEGEQPSDVTDGSEEVKEELQDSESVPGMEVEGQQPSDIPEESEEVKEESQDSEDVPEMEVEGQQPSEGTDTLAGKQESGDNDVTANDTETKPVETLENEKKVEDISASSATETTGNTSNIEE